MLVGLCQWIHPASGHRCVLGLVFRWVTVFNSLEIFGTMSGLTMDKHKTKIIWIDRKRYSREKLLDTGLQWGFQEFEILGLKFSIHLDNIVSLNFNPKILEIKRMINNCGKRQLTPL